MSGELLAQSGTVVRAGLLLLSYLTALSAGAFGVTGLFAVAGLAIIVGELEALVWTPAVRELLERGGIGQVYRGLARDLSVVLIVVASIEPSASQTAVVLLAPALVGVTAVATAHSVW